MRAEADLVNISLGGACIEGERPLSTGRQYRLRIPGGARQLDLVGRTVWNRLTGTRAAGEGEVQPVYRAGVSFEREDRSGTTNERELDEFIAERAVENYREGASQRYRLADIGPVTLEAWCDLEVRSISASGALVELELLGEPSSPVQVTLQLPWVPLKVEARVVRSERVLDETRGPRTRLALEFESLAERDRHQIEALVAEGLGRRDAPGPDPS